MSKEDERVRLVRERKGNETWDREGTDKQT